MGIVKAFIFALIFLVNISAVASDRGHRIEELFLWKICDELKLTSEQEKKLSDIVHGLDTKKANAHSRLESDLKTLKEAKSPKDRKVALSKYRKSLESSLKIPLEELDQIKSALGEEKLAEYLQVRKDLTEKVKAMFVEKGEKVEDPPLPPPKLIEEITTSTTLPAK